MNDAVEFYNIMSPIILDSQFCSDVDISIISGKKHDRCPRDIENSKYLAGIKKKNTELITFFKKDYKEKSINFDIVLISCILILVIWKLKH